MMGCFSSSATKVVKQRSSSAPRSGPLRSVIASKDSLTLLANKPVELPEPESIVGRCDEVEQWSSGGKAPAGRVGRFSDGGESPPGHRKSRTQILKGVEEGRTAFSGPLVGSNARVGKVVSTKLSHGYESGCDASSCVRLKTLRRTTSFGGRPQPLPLPVTEETAPDPGPAPGANATAVNREIFLFEDAGRRSRRVRSFTLEDGAGLRSGRRGRVAPVGAVPLPPPSLAGKLLDMDRLG